MAAGVSVGIVGAGSIAGDHIRAWQGLGASVLLHSPRTGRRVADGYGIRYCASLVELLAAVDMVVVCAPTDTHFALASAAVEAGRPVLCEKPLTRWPAQARALLHAAAAAGVPVVPAHVVRFFPAYQVLADAVGAGTVGSVQAVRLSRVGPAPSSGWFTDVARSGGLMDLMVHDLDVARWLAGEVVGVVAAQHPATVDGRLPDVVSAQVSLTHANGALSQLHGRWGPPGSAFRTAVEVWGTAGSLRSDNGPEHRVVAESGGRSVLLPVADDGDAFRAQAADFLALVRGGTASRVTGADGLAAVVLMDAVLGSIDNGLPVTVAVDQR